MPYIGQQEIEQVDCQLVMSLIASEVRGQITYELPWPPTRQSLGGLASMAQASILAGLVLSRINISRLPGLRCRAVYHYTAQENVMTNIGQIEAEKPRYTLRGSCTQEPLLTHPKFKDITGEPLEGLNALLNGYSEGDEINAKDGKKKVSELLGADPIVQKAAELIKKGQSYYYCPTITWQERVAARNMTGVSVTGLGKISSPPGGAPAGGSRNYLLSSIDAEMTGTKDRVDIVRSWELSGPGGWNRDLYGS